MRISLSLAALGLVGVCLVGWYPSVAGAGEEQAAAWIEPTGAIPREGFKSWSLFLVCDAEWLSPEKASDLNRLYRSFERFGTAIGDENLAVWFWKDRMTEANPKLPGNVDVERSVRFCRQLGLAPSEGPYVVWMAQYPAEPLPALAEGAARPEVIGLGGLRADRLAELLRRAGDELARSGKLTAPSPPSFFLRFIAAAQQAMTDFGCSVNLKFSAGAVSAELRECKG
jgi:hypothetical protein